MVTFILLFSEQDGNQELHFYWIDPIQAMKRYITKKKYAEKLYTRFQAEWSAMDRTKRAFSKSNSGAVFQAAQMLYPQGSPVLALFYADASYAKQTMTHHPIYSKLIISIIAIISIISIISII